MPTKHRRIAITETPRVKTALDEARAELAPGERLDVAELVVIGARQVVSDRQAEQRRQETGLRTLAHRVRTRDFDFDWDEADRLRRSAWTRS